MPHDIKGREVKPGAFVKHKIWDSERGTSVMVVGRIVSLFPANDTCNATACRAVFGGTVTDLITLKESELVLDESGAEPAQP